MLGRRPPVVLALGVAAIVLLSSLGLAGASAASPSRLSVARGPVAPGASSAARAAPERSLPLTARPAAPARTNASAEPSDLLRPSGPLSAELAQLHSIHAPLKYAFLPNLNAAPDPGLSNGIIQFGYSSVPAPLGVAAYGIRNASGVLTPYSLSTSSVEGTFAPQSLSGLAMDISAPDRYAVQLNAVLENVTLFGTPSYEFWTQNIVEYSTYSHQIFFISNIWNFSSSNHAFDLVTPSTFYQVGPNGTVVSPDFYYGLGGPVNVSYPFTLHTFLNSSIVGGRDAVFFNFTVANATRFYAGSFDHAIFNSSMPGRPAAPDLAYVTSGGTYTDYGLPGDFEMVLGGPAGGSNLDVLSADAYLGLQYWNASEKAYSVVPSAYDFGSDTGETAVGASVLWGPGSGLPGGSPNALLTQGPTMLEGLWNVSGASGGPTGYGGAVYLDLRPANAFVFLAPGAVFSGWNSTNWSLFEWAPYSALPDELGAGTWTAIGILANYAPVETTFIVVPSLVTVVNLSLSPDPAEGVYTPLWAFGNGAVANISALGALANDQYGPIGDAYSSGVSFPWFGLANDFLYPVFPGIWLWNTTVPTVVNNPPSLETQYPASIAAELEAVGFPTTNDLQMLFYDDSHVTLTNGANIAGWWYWGAYNGPAVSAYNVVFWNTSYSVISGNTFNTGGNALYLYGGSFNLVVNNTFRATLPASTDQYASVAGTYGSVGIFEGDYGNATAVAARLGEPNVTSRCFAGGSTGFCDLIFNNIFLTEITADSPLYDPYAFYTAYPTCPAWLAAANTSCYFDEAWNALPGAFNWSLNILGSPGIGGNLWWNYGSVENPYNAIPYFALSPFTAAGLTYINWGGDYLPLSLVPLYHAEFVETGLPAGTHWYVSGYSGTFGETGFSTMNITTLILPAGTYSYVPGSLNTSYAAYGGSFSLTNRSLVLDLEFRPAITIEFFEQGLVNRWDWWVEVDTSSGLYLATVESTGASLNVSGLLPGSYVYRTYVSGFAFAPLPSIAAITVTGNTSVVVTFLPIHEVQLIQHGLAPGTVWWVRLWNSTVSELIVGEADVSEVTIPGFSVSGPLNWSVFAANYVALPAEGEITFAANGTVNIQFSLPATLTFNETGLASGAGWTVWLTQYGVTFDETTTSNSMVFSAARGPYNYTVSAPGYFASGTYGSGELPQSVPVVVGFTPITALDGTLRLSVTTTFAFASVNGVDVSLPFRASEEPGLYAIVVTSPGYLPYFNNVSVVSGESTNLSVSLVPVPTYPSGPTATGFSSLVWIVVATLAALVVLFLATTLWVRRRGKTPPPPAAAPPRPAASSDVPSWMETTSTWPDEGSRPPPSRGN